MTDPGDATRAAWIAKAEKVPAAKQRAFALALHYHGEEIAVARARLGISFDAAMGLVEITKTMPWRPSNGSDGEVFRCQFCDRCEKDRYESHPCGIFTRTMIYDVDDPKYPKQWIENIGVPWNERDPRCTAFVEIGTVPRKRSARRTISDKRQEGLLL